MKFTNNLYINLLIVHLIMGFVFFFIPFLAQVYGIGIFLFGIAYVINTQNRNNEVLLMGAYFTGIDVYLKMAGGSLLNEYGKYTVLIFMALGIFYKGFSKGAFIYVFFIALLIPGVYIGASTLSFDANIRKAIAFNIVGPVCLGVTAVYCFQREISLSRIKDVFTMLLLPLVAMLVHLFLYAPNVQEVVMDTQSNFQTSGGFGPNQVSTVLGLGMFLAFSRLFLASPSKIFQIINSILVAIFAYRCIITFSRGGMYTGLLMIILLSIMVYNVVNLKSKARIIALSVVGLFAALAIWSYSSLQTGGMIDKRYANENKAGVEKKSKLSGRETLIESEFEMFMDNPLLGVGVGRNKEVRLEETGIVAASHNEISRMLAEHGSLGILGLLILFLTPIFLYLNDRTQIFALVFMAFWLLTINHAAMRIAAPAFIYGLALLKVRLVDEGERVV